MLLQPTLFNSSLRATRCFLPHNSMSCHLFTVVQVHVSPAEKKYCSDTKGVCKVPLSPQTQHLHHLSYNLHVIAVPSLSFSLPLRFSHPPPSPSLSLSPSLVPPPFPFSRSSPLPPPYLALPLSPSLVLPFSRSSPSPLSLSCSQPLVCAGSTSYYRTYLVKMKIVV